MPPSASLSYRLEDPPVGADGNVLADAAARADAAADLAACREQLRDGSRTFLAASRLLPASVRDPATALYAFCRSADDAVDLDAVDELA
ncbi:MAG TPA: squalene/phytoene synthase family protein, partial [Burkholderiaceae bacterium]|nr:squalene/phytoene synthase family protein [Burkholderiaceae bacterium]